MSSLRRFFFCVVGWTPKTVMYEASVQDLQDCYAGFYVGTDVSDTPDATFLQNMMNKFPDERMNNDK